MRLSVTTVEAYRLWREGDWMALETLEAQIRREAPETERMLRGKAFHAVIEDPDGTLREALGEVNYESGGFHFSGEGIERVLALMPRDGTPEVKATTDIDGITLVAKADGLHGLDVYEAKLTARINVDSYLESFQWRAYLKIFHAMRARYVIAQGSDGEFVRIGDVMPMDLYRYPKLDDDVRRLMNECADFIVKRNLDSYVQDIAA